MKKFKGKSHFLFALGLGLATLLLVAGEINEFKYDMTMHGPILALNFSW